MTHVSLFTGIGGIDLAGEWAGFRTIVQVERDPYCQRVLERHWPGVHRVSDIRDFPDQDYGTVTLVSGGFPCQPFSAAGKRRGTEDDRHLWPEMFRVIRDVKPKFVLAENVPGILAIESGMVFESVLTDLEAAGYETWAGLIPAAGAGAPHLRYRVFILGSCAERNPREYPEISEHTWASDATGHNEYGLVARTIVGHTTRSRWSNGKSTRLDMEGECVLSGRRQQGNNKTDGSSQDVADTENSNGRGANGKDNSRWRNQEIRRCCIPRTGAEYWSLEPDVGRVAYGVPHRVDRLRALGNAVVPQQVYPILKAIAEVELST